jgi:hypothetical protein
MLRDDGEKGAPETESLTAKQTTTNSNKQHFYSIAAINSRTVLEGKVKKLTSNNTTSIEEDDNKLFQYHHDDNIFMI